MVMEKMEKNKIEDKKPLIGSQFQKEKVEINKEITKLKKNLKDDNQLKSEDSDQNKRNKNKNENNNSDGSKENSSEANLNKQSRKRSRLSEEEKALREAKRISRQAELETERLEREEKKRQKDEEKAKRAAEREEKQKMKELERKQKEEERKKKEKQQPGINMFFSKKPTKPPTENNRYGRFSLLSNYKLRKEGKETLDQSSHLNSNGTTSIEIDLESGEDENDKENESKKYTNKNKNKEINDDDCIEVEINTGLFNGKKVKLGNVTNNDSIMQKKGKNDNKVDRKINNKENSSEFSHKEDTENIPLNCLLWSKFQPFHIKQNMEILPYNFFIESRSLRQLEEIKNTMEKYLSNGDDKEVLFGKEDCIKDFKKRYPLRKRRLGKLKLKMTPQQIVSQSSTLSEKELHLLLKSLPNKHLQFCEDLRPPYQGTFCKELKKYYRMNPFFKDEQLNYDYDSEAEWFDDEEGSDIEDSDNEEEEPADHETEEMNEFLEEDDAANKRKQFHQLEPLVEGISWTDLLSGENNLFDGRGFNIEIINSGNIGIPIDPFKDYWTTETTTNSSLKSDSNIKSSKNSTNGNEVKKNMNNTKSVPNGQTTTSQNGTDSTNGKNKKLVDNSILGEVLKYVQDSDANQILLVEMLKKKFSSASKEAIRNTLRTYCTRVGNRESEKRWKVLPEAWEQVSH